jgi:hypothetical protein
MRFALDIFKAVQRAFEFYTISFECWRLQMTALLRPHFYTSAASSGVSYARASRQKKSR